MADGNDAGAKGNTDDGGTLLKPGEETKPKEGEETKPKEGEETKPKEGEETKPKEGEETKPKEGEETKPKEGEGAPTKYEDFALPEGAVVNDALMGEFSILAKELNLPQDSAQKVIDLVPKLTESIMTKQAEDWQGVRDAWVKDIKEDPELGGNNLAETLERANRVMRNYASAELRTLMADTGYGDNADLVRMLHKIDVALGEDLVVDGVPPGGEGKSAAEKMYPKQGK